MAFSLIVTGCVTRKKKEDLSFMGKLYHNITAKYNGYFNANVLYDEAIIKLNAQHIDNYTKILDLYPYMAVENPKAVGPDMDKVVSKVSTVATVHPGSGWVDDCFLLAGKAQHIKQDYESAQETLEYMAKEFSPEALKEKMSSKNKAKAREKELKNKKKVKEKVKKEQAKEKAEVKKEKEKTKAEIKKEKEKEREQRIKENKAKAKEREKARKNKSKAKKIEEAPVVKMDMPKTTPTEEAKPEEKEKVEKKETVKKEEKEKPEKYFLKRKPAYQEGLLWLCRTYIERQKYDEASRIINKLSTDPKVFPYVLQQLAPVEAYFYLKQKKYEAAIEPLENAIKLSDNGKDKARYSYIIAQIHQSKGNQSEALASYQRTLKFSPPYEMEFNAKLNIALNSYRSGKSTIDIARKDLQRMLKDSKNAEFKDQIYFTLAKLDLEAKDNPAAINDLMASLKSNTANKIQKTESYLLLAELYFGQGSFVSSKNYYDSTLQVMNTTDDRYAATQRFSNSLIEIARNQQIVILQDSLLRLAGLSDKELKEVAKAIKEKQEADAKKQSNQAAQAKNDPNSQVSINNSLRNQSGAIPQFGNNKSSFFAYDSKAVKKGQKEFEKRWGNRQLADNWRRSKTTSAPDNSQPGDNNYVTDEILDKEYQSILKDVPKTPQQKDEANNKIMTSMIALGRLYMDQLKDNDRSIKELKDYLARYPNSKYELEAWYYLYLAHSAKGEIAEAKVYYDLIVGKYPNTNYARVLSDPNYLNQTLAERKRLDTYYNETYALFQSGQYEKAQDNIKKVPKDFGVDNKYKAKFALLDAMCLGSTQGKNAYIGGLKDVIAKYPDSEEEKRAKEIIRLLGVESAKPLEKKNQHQEAQPYTYTPDDVHYVIFMTGNVPDKLNTIKTSIASYNQEFYSFDKLKVTNIFLDTETPLIVVRQFDKSENATKYIENVYKNKDSFYKDLKDDQLIIISKENYKSLLLNKDVKIYLDFLKNNYK